MNENTLNWLVSVIYTYWFVPSLEFTEIFQVIFQTSKKVWKNGEWVWWSWVLFVSKLQQVLYKWNFRLDQILFNLACTFAVHYEKSFVLLITYLITFILKKKLPGIVWQKIWKKVLNFGSKNLYEPCIHVFMLMSCFSVMPGTFC